MKWILFSILAALAILPLSTGCDDDDDSSSDGDTDTDTDTDTDPGSVEITGNWDGTAPDGTGLRVSIFECPFSMPPKYFFEGTWDPATGDVEALQENVEPGDWCLMAYIDMDDTDGLAPMDGLDPVNATGDENSDGAIPIVVEAGETTVVDLVFEI